MIQPESSPSDSTQTSGTSDLHERAARLREKVGELAETFERIEQNLADASDEQEDSSG